jgi:adenylate kinase family enzyme
VFHTYVLYLTIPPPLLLFPSSFTPPHLTHRITFERQLGLTPHLILFLDCPWEVLERRILARNQGRADDNLATLRKRWDTYTRETLPVITHYERLGRVQRIAGARGVEEVFADVAAAVAPLAELAGAARAPAGSVGGTKM